MFEVGKRVVKKGIPVLAGNVTQYHLNKGKIELNRKLKEVRFQEYH